jgi:hypothetical protein
VNAIEVPGCIELHDHGGIAEESIDSLKELMK